MPAAFQPPLSLAYHTIVHETQRLMAQRMAAKVRLRHADHTPTVAAPPVVVEIIREAIRVTAAT
jgi:hypothetical protein